MLLHIVFGIVEMVFWPRVGSRLLGTSDPRAVKLTTPMAINQGLYNLFVAAVLLVAVLLGSENIAIFGLLFVILAGIVGWWTVTFRIFLVQSVPAIIALAFVIARI
jgi:putative membrane protein